MGYAVLVAPYHPSSNGLAEWAVKTVKQGISKMTEGTLQDKLSRFLFNYHLMPHTTTDRALAELMMGRQIWSRLELVKPQLKHHVQEKQLKQKETHDKHAKVRSFKEGEEVFAKNYTGAGNRWLSGKVVQVTGPVSAAIELDDGTKVRKHFDQLRKRTTGLPIEQEQAGSAALEQSAEAELESSVELSHSELESETPAEVPVDPPRRSYPSRNRRPPERLEPTY